jgi:hypothetical protein
MKGLSMKTKETLRNLGATLLVALCSVQAYAGDGNGQGHNGPTISPISLPPGVEEHGLALDVVREAGHVCFIKGATDRGVKSLLQKLGEQVYEVRFDTGRHGFGLVPNYKGKTFLKMNCPDNNEFAKFFGMCPKMDVRMEGAGSFQEWNTDKKSSGIKLHRRVGVASSSSETGVRYKDEFYSVSYGRQSAAFELKHAGYYGYEHDGALRLPEGVALPEVIWASVIEKEKRNKVQQPIGVEHYVKGLALKLNGNGLVSLVNVTSGIETPIDIDLDAYADCLRNEIQRGASAQ